MNGISEWDCKWDYLFAEIGKCQRKREFGFSRGSWINETCIGSLGWRYIWEPLTYK